MGQQFLTSTLTCQSMKNMSNKSHALLKVTGSKVPNLVNLGGLHETNY